VEQLSKSGTADMADKMIEGLGDGKGFLLGTSQEVEVVQDGAFQVAQVTVRRTAAAQAQPEQEQPPPAEKAAVILDHGHVASVGQLVQPPGQLREEVSDGSEKDSDQGYDLPRLRRLAVTWD